MNTDRIYQRIGEFVVCYQWIENKIREIGWLILDPYRRQWPPKQLREENSDALFAKVESLFVDLMNRLDVPDKNERTANFRSIVAGCHAMRRYRNNLLHSAFIELKAGGEVMGMLRSNPRIKSDPKSRKVMYDQEELTARAISEKLGKLGALALPLGQHYVQLIHWAPFESQPKFPSD